MNLLMGILQQWLCIVYLSLCCKGVSSLKVSSTSDSVIKANPQRTFDLVSLSLSRFGSKAYTGNAHENLETRTSVPLRAAHPLCKKVLQLIVRFSSTGENDRLLYIFGLVLLLAILALIYTSWGDSDESSPKRIPELESSMGIWACKYRDSTMLEKEAIELLFKCGILSQEDLADTQVSQDHIAECIALADRMLLKMSTEDWLRLKQNNPDKFRALSEDAMDVFFRDPPTPRTGELHPAQIPTIRTEFTPEFEQKGADAAFNTAVATYGDHTQRRKSRSPGRGIGNEMIPGKSPVPILNCSSEDLYENPTTNSSLSTTAHGEKEDELFSAIMATTPKELSHAQAAMDVGSSSSASPFPENSGLRLSITSTSATHPLFLAAPSVACAANSPRGPVPLRSVQESDADRR